MKSARTTKPPTTPGPKNVSRQTEPITPGRSDDRHDRLLIVGVGASAGGLEAFTQLLAHLPVDTGMAFVLVQHLDPDHPSALTEILSRATSLPVREIRQNQRVQADHVYIIPRDTNLRIERGVLKLQPRDRKRSPHRPIDAFFESLAQDQRERAIGVVLSGTASDGTQGLAAIKEEGGITFAQDGSAKYNSMPRSAVAAGCVDLILSPEAIASELARIAKHPYVAGSPIELPTRAEQDHANAVAHQDDALALPSGGRGTPPTGGRQARDEAEREEKGQDNHVPDGYQTIMVLLRNHSGVDFSLYRSSTIRRRITRRILLTKQDTLKGYARFLRGNTAELDALFSDVLISVTSFFRNPEIFELLQTEILPKLLAQRREDPIRCWVLGCSTGQEAYSLAMSFVEAARNAPRARPIQIFATDLNEKLLEKARQGLYAKTLAQDISPERLREFFVEEDGGYRIKKALRELVVFARQNLLADPPFSRMDLISCRNLLIYLEPSLQQKALPTFHYALKPDGYLLLGASESVGGFTDLFEPVDRKHKIFAKKPRPTPGFRRSAKKEGAVRATPKRQPPLPIGKTALPAGTEPVEGFRCELNAQREADRIVVAQFSPPAVLINDQLQVLQFRGPTGAYLQPPTGKASFDVLKMAREGLMLPLRAAITEAKQRHETVHKERVRVTRDDVTKTIHLTVIPLKNMQERCFMILFEEADKTRRAASLPSPSRKPAASRVSMREESRRIVELEADLSQTREYLQSLQEQHESTTDELQASNEEIQSANEELQSINEELETSKEELESTNEELSTVNEEIVHRNADLSLVNGDLLNLENSVTLAIILLNRNLTIRRFSRQAEKQFDLLATDIGTPVSRLGHNLVWADGAEPPLDLAALSAQVIADLREHEREVRDKAGGWYSLRVRPYLTLDNKVDGAVLVLVDISSLKRSEEIIRAQRDLANVVVETVREPLLVLDPDLRVEQANQAFYKTFGGGPVETLGTRLGELGNHQWDIPRLRELLTDVVVQSSTVEGFLVEQDFPQVGRRSMLLNAQSMNHPSQKTPRILMAIEDVTDRANLEHKRQETEERLLAFSSELEQLVSARTKELVESENHLRAMTIDLNLTEQRERERLACELHDYLAQLLVLCCLNLGQVRRVPLSPKMEELLMETEEALNQALNYCRTLMAELSPPVLRTHGLPAALKWLGEQMQHRGVKVTVECEHPNDLKIPEDTGILLFQSVRELLMNVVKHAKSEQATVRLAQCDGALRLAVSDNGTGFDPIAVHPTSTNPLSSHFGLFSIGERMKGMNGRLELQSAPGKGTTATLILPWPVPTGSAAQELLPVATRTEDSGLASLSRSGLRTESSESDGSALSPQSPALQKKATIRVLLVDDHAMVRQGLRSVLEQYEDVMVVGEAGNGKEAVDQVDALHPSVVVMDINMPEMNGIEATAAIKARYPDISVIGLSVQAGGANEEAMKKAGAATLLTKEAAVEDLYRTIREALALDHLRE